MRSLTIGHYTITDDSPAFVVAEIGHNHQGSVERCKDLFKAAAECGVQAVKLQKRDNKTLYTPEMYNSPYNGDHSFGRTYGEHREALEFDFDQYRELKAYAESLGVLFFATAFDKPSVDFLLAVGVPALKIASGDLQNIPLIRYAAGKGLPLIISTGGGTLDDVDRADLALPDDAPAAYLQCTASYPAKPEEMNLRVILAYRERYPDVVIGLSDHQDGIDLAPVAYAFGARVFEKHFTLDHTWKGSDQAFSLEPEGMRHMVRSLERTRVAMGDGVKRRYESEEKPLYKMEKAIWPAAYYTGGYTVLPGDLELRSPGGGLPAWKLDKFSGRTLREPLDAWKSVDSSGVLEP